MIIVSGLAVAATVMSSQPMSVVMPHGIPDGPRSAAIVCRDSNGGWSTAVDWREVTGPAFALPPTAAGRCRVLVRVSAAIAFMASSELLLDRTMSAVFINPQWLRNVEAPPASGDVMWLGAGDGVECVPLAKRVRCWFVPLASAGVLVARAPSQFQFTVVQPGAANVVSVWQPAVWGRLIRARSPSGAVAAAVVTLHDALKHGAGRLREARPAGGMTVSRLAPETFWISGTIDPAAYLELRGDRAATTRLSLADMAAPGAAIVDVTLPHHEVISGEVRGGGAIVEGAAVMLSRILDAPRPGVPDGERPRERIAEATTGSAGEFRFESLSAAKYELFVVHPSIGRRMAVVAAPTHARLQLEPRAILRGKVLRHGVPVAGAVVQVLPSLDAVAASRNPAALGSAAVRTGPTGRFEVIAPDEGRVTLSAASDGGAFRLELGDAAALPQVTDVGDITLDDPIAVELLIELPAGCELRAAGPMGAAGLSAIRAEAAGQGRWILRPPQSGRWLLAGVCGGAEIALEPALIAVPLARAAPVLLKARR